MIINLENCLVPGCEGADHRFEFERPTAREIKRIQQVVGMDLDVFAEGLDAGGASEKGIDAALALVDILHRRIGIKVPFEEIDLDIFGFDIELEPGESETPEPEPEPEDGEGKDPALTDISLPPADAGPASTSGPEPAAASAPSSSPTPTGSGSTSA